MTKSGVGWFKTHSGIQHAYCQMFVVGTSLDFNLGLRQCNVKFFDIFPEGLASL